MQNSMISLIIFETSIKSHLFNFAFSYLSLHNRLFSLPIINLINSLLDIIIQSAASFICIDTSFIPEAWSLFSHLLFPRPPNVPTLSHPLSPPQSGRGRVSLALGNLTRSLPLSKHISRFFLSLSPQPRTTILLICLF